MPHADVNAALYLGLHRHELFEYKSAGGETVVWFRYGYGVAAGGGNINAGSGLTVRPFKFSVAATVGDFDEARLSGAKAIRNKVGGVSAVFLG